MGIWDQLCDRRATTTSERARAFTLSALGFVALGSVVLSLSGLGFFGLAPAAQAQAGCQETSFAVDSAAGFNQAIVCFNQFTQPEFVQIELLDDIAADTVAGNAVFEPLRPEARSQLTILGNGHTLSRSAAAETAPAPLLQIVDSPPADPFSTWSTLFMIDLGLEVGPNETAGIYQGMRSYVDLVRVSITASAAGSGATGLVSNSDSGRLDLRDSLIEGMPIGVETLSGEVLIETSTVASTGTDLLFGPDAPAAFVRNSTLGGPVGVELTNNVVQVAHTTIAGDGLKAGAAAASDAAGSVVFRSSLVQSCSAPESTDQQQGPSFQTDDSSFGGCFDSGQVIAMALADNGCGNPTPAGCPPTIAINASSPVRYQGDCSDATSNRDQRNMLRTPAGPGCEPGAFEYNGCAQGGATDVQVRTHREFTAAIECLNSAKADGASVTITLLNDIESDTATSDGVFQQISLRRDSQLAINGNGHTLRRNAGAPTTAAPLLSVAGGVLTSIEISELELELGPYDTYGINSSSSRADLFFRRSRILASPGSTATGIQAYPWRPAQLLVEESTFEHLRIGLQTTGPATVWNSTIASSEIDVLPVRGGLSFGSSLSIVGSTLTAPIGLQVDTGLTFVSRSTVLGDGAALSERSTGTISFTSSIVNSCSATVWPFSSDDDKPLDLPIVRGEGGNVGGCFNPGEQIDTELADNGCVEPGVFGCTRTVALNTNSAAIGAGYCANQSGLPADTTDQRGEPLTPVGPGCDAGAYEFAPCASGSDVFTVGSDGELATAISCFNQGAFGPGDYTIDLSADIAANIAGSRATILQPLAGYSLTIEGNGNTVSTSASTGPRQPRDELRSLLSVDSTNVAPLSVRNVVLAGDQDAGFDLFFSVWNDSPTALTVENSVIKLLDGNAAIHSIRGGDLTIAGSIVEFSIAGIATTGIRMTGGQLTVSDTSVVNLQPEILAPGIDFEAGSIDITNSTFDHAPIYSGVGAVGTISNSTFDGGGIPGIGALGIRSSIVNDCNPIVRDLGGNVGACFGSQVDLGGSADNGCAVTTPQGCPLTFALQPDSPARTAGDCTGVLTDQRGEPRTPVGPGCDAGAFELDQCASGDVNVDSEDKLISAIDCFNQGEFGPGLFTVNLTASFDVTHLITQTVIDQPLPAYILLFQGNGHTITFREPIETPTEPVRPRGILTFAPTHTARSLIRDMFIEVDDAVNPELDWLVANHSVEELQFVNVGLQITGGTAAVISDGGADLIFDGSTIEIAGAAGIIASGGSGPNAYLAISNTAIVNLQPDSLGTAIDIRSGILDINFGRFDNAAIVGSDDVFALIRRSTFTGPSLNGSSGYGDINLSGVATNADAQALLDWLAGGDPPLGLGSGDLNNDGIVKLDDALAIAQLVAG